MKQTVLLIASLICYFFSVAQSTVLYKGENINALDENNNQTGVWKYFDEEKKLLITCEFKEGKKVAATRYYRDSVLVAAYNNEDKIDIYKGAEVISCSFTRKANGSIALLDSNGKEVDSETNKKYNEVSQVMPFFYGGTKKLYEFIQKNFNGQGNKGSLKVKFVIDTRGFATQPEIIESSNSKLNDEAIRVVSILPRWQPAHQKGMFVKFVYIVPITMN